MKQALQATRHAIDLDGHHLPIVIRKHARSRRMVIRYQPIYHCLTLTLPRYSTIRQGLRFVEEKRGWIARQLQEAAKVALTDGEVIPVLGVPHQIVHVGGRGLVQAGEGRILVTGDAKFMPRRVRDWLTQLARAEIQQLAAEKAAAINVTFRRIHMRDTSSHWGSCSHDGSMSFSWRLVFAPREILEYVVCHEVAHLAELNHSPAFWGLVEKLYPDFKNAREWLKTQGGRLYAYR